MKSLIGAACLLIVGVLSTPATGDYIQDLFNTGVLSDDEFGTNATLLPVGFPDPHYQFISGPQFPATFPQAEVIASHPSWSANGPDSMWIGPIDGTESAAPGTYVYQTSFTIAPGENPASADISGYWSLDNGDAHIFLNGTDVGVDPNPGFNAPLPGTAFNIQDGTGGARFVSGTNTLRFSVVNDVASGINPTGLRITQIQGTVQPNPQKIVLDFSDPVPFQISDAEDSFGHSHLAVNASGTMTAASISVSQQQEILTEVKNTFLDSGITNIDVSIGQATPSAKIVYFTPFDRSSNTEGFAPLTDGKFDRFNVDPSGAVVVYALSDAQIENSLPGPNAQTDANFLDAYTAVHELGHALGLRHVEPIDTSTGQPLPEIMRPDAPTYGDTTPASFINALSNITDTKTLLTENPSYYLKRWVNGESDQSLRAQGVLPGSWDTPSVFNDYRVWLDNFTNPDSKSALYNVDIASNFSEPDLSSVIAHFDEITTSELAGMSFEVSPGSTVSFFASSTIAGDQNITISTGDPFDVNSVTIPVDSGSISASLVMASESGDYSILGDVAVNSELIPEPSQASIGFALILIFSFNRRRNCAIDPVAPFLHGLL